jgi:hypothetical protein
MDVTRLITTRQNDAALKKEQVKIILLTMYVSYVLTRNHGGYSSLREMLIRHYRTDREIQQSLKDYTLG